MNEASVYRGAAWLVLSEALFSAVGALVKYIDGDINTTQLVFFRNLFALMALLPWLLSKGLGSIKTQRFGLHLTRASAGLMGTYCIFFIFTKLPLNQAVMGLLMAPFIMPVISRYWLKESISLKTWAGIAIAFIGALMILSPQQEHTGISPYVLVALVCACFVAFTKCTIRKLSETEPSTRIVFYFSSLALIGSFIPMLIFWQPIAPGHWGLLCLLGMFAAGGQLSMTKAFSYASPARIGLLTYSSLLFAAVAGYLIWDEPVTAAFMLSFFVLLWAANLTLRQRWFM